MRAIQGQQSQLMTRIQNPAKALCWNLQGKIFFHNKDKRQLYNDSAAHLCWPSETIRHLRPTFKCRDYFLDFLLYT